MAMAKYVCKAKVAGMNASDEYVRDKWADKRLLFAEHVNLCKYGTVGKFWLKTKKQLWQEVIEEETGIASYRSAVYVEARMIHDLVDEWVSFRKVSRELSVWAWRGSMSFSGVSM